MECGKKKNNTPCDFKEATLGFLTVNLSLASTKLNTVGDIFTPLKAELTVNLFRLRRLRGGLRSVSLFSVGKYDFFKKKIQYRLFFSTSYLPFYLEPGVFKGKVYKWVLFVLLCLCLKYVN